MTRGAITNIPRLVCTFRDVVRSISKPHCHISILRGSSIFDSYSKAIQCIFREPGIPISTSQEQWQLVFDFAYAFGFDSLWVAASQNLGRPIDPIDKIRIGRRRGYKDLMREGLEELSKSSWIPPSPDSEDAKVVGYDGLRTIMELRLQRTLTVTIPPPIVEVPRAGMSSQNDQRDRQPNPILSPVEAVYNPNQSVTISESITRVDYSPLLSSAATHRSFFLPGILHVQPSRPEWNERPTEHADSRRHPTKVSTPRIVEIDDLMETIVFDPTTPVRPSSSRSVNIDSPSGGRRVARAAVREHTASFIHRSLAARQESEAVLDLDITRKGMSDQSETQTHVYPEVAGEEPVEQHAGANAVTPISHAAYGDALSSCASTPPPSSPPSSLSVAEADTVVVTLETAEYHGVPGADGPAMLTSNIHADISMAHLPQSTPASSSNEIHPIVSSPAAANTTLKDNFDTAGVEASDILELHSSGAEGSGVIELPPGEISPPSPAASLGSPSIPPKSNPSIPMVKTENAAVDRRHHLDDGFAAGDVIPGHLSTQADSHSDNDALPGLHHVPPESVHPENISLPISPPVSQSPCLHSSQPSLHHLPLESVHPENISLPLSPPVSQSSCLHSSKPGLHHLPPESVHPENISLPLSPPVSQSSCLHSSKPGLHHLPPESVHPENISLPLSPPVSQSPVLHSPVLGTPDLTTKNTFNRTKELDVFDEGSAVAPDPRYTMATMEIKSKVASTHNPNPDPSALQASPTLSTELSSREGQTSDAPFGYDSSSLRDKAPNETAAVQRTEAAPVDSQDGGTGAAAKSQEGGQDHGEGLRMVANVEAVRGSDTESEEEAKTKIEEGAGEARTNTKGNIDMKLE
ncbi:hypothetical protein HWV62_14868 [Athelia sp. TMB]|nr:hypothetical protein HWV62_14868 [Athelia sp. TMB]